MSQPQEKAVILLSGGLDSAANLALACEPGSGSRVVLALTADYGQQAAQREVEAAGRLASFYQVPHRVIDLRWLGELGGSALTRSGSSVPEPGADELDVEAVTRETAAAVWVPNRNGVFIHLAAAFAESLGATQILVGFNREEAATFPDNSTAYLEAVSGALKYSTANGVRVRSFTDRLDKREIVGRLRSLVGRAFPMDLVWSCYLGGSDRCGRCESCRRLERALSEAKEGC